jgi:hypothetical protein
VEALEGGEIVTVFISNFNEGHDYTSAEKYGKLVSLTEGTVNLFAVDRLTAQLRRDLAAFDHDQDFFLVSGHLHIAVVAAAILGADHPHFQVLLFNAKSRRYVARTVTLTVPQRAEGRQQDVSVQGVPGAPRVDPGPKE